MRGIKSHPHEVAFVQKWSKYLLLKQFTNSAHFGFFFYGFLNLRKVSYMA